MKQIERSQGITDSERYLSRLADKTFLELWTYPNTFKEIGKELCDLLVVCGNDVIIFSDKSIRWPQSDNAELSWSRWYRRAIKKSVNQIRGAERWLRQFPDWIFLDPLCTRKLPISLPPLERRRVHGIAIALGAQEACSQYHDDEDGSLIVLSHLKGNAHTNPKAENYLPFAIGDVDPSGPFIHVFDETALDLVMREMDTVSDFVDYLIEREKAIREERVAFSPGEAEMLAAYMQTENADHKHAFPNPEALGANPDFKIMLPTGSYANFVASDSYKRKKIADAESYIWDRLIGIFTSNIIAGTSVEVLGELPTAARAEPALRIMARENRVVRRVLGSAFSGALREAERLRRDRFTRVILPSEAFADPKAGYVFMILAYPTKFELEDGYEQYRRTRVAMLEAYCAVALYDNRNAKRMVGIAIDASSRVTGRRGGSEDLLAIEIEDWTPELERGIEERRAHFDILNHHTLKFGTHSTFEYPALTPQNPSRQQRRAEERRAKKAARKS